MKFRLCASVNGQIHYLVDRVLIFGDADVLELLKEKIDEALTSPATEGNGKHLRFGEPPGEYKDIIIVRVDNDERWNYINENF